MTRKRGKFKVKTKSDSSQKSEDEVQYCICRSSDGTRFMIACDNCEEWYHGDCINVTPKQANNIKKFYCHLCIGRNPSLEIEYKTIKETRPRAPNLRQQIKKINFSSDDENDADMSSSSTPDKSFASGRSKRSVRKRSRNSTSETKPLSIAKKKRGRPRERPDEYDEEATEDEMETAGIAPSLNDCNPIGLVDVPTDTGMFNKKPFHRLIGNNYGDRLNNMEIKPCGICDGCKSTSSNCGKCDLCVKYRNTGMESRLSCRKKMCHRLRSAMNVCPNPRYDDEYENVLDERNYIRQNNGSEYDIREIRHRLMNPAAINSGKTLSQQTAGATTNTGNVPTGASLGSKMRRGDHLPGGNSSLAVSSRRISGSSAVSGLGGQNLKYYTEEEHDHCLDVTAAAANGSHYHTQQQQHHRYHNTSATRLSRNHNTVPQHRRSRNSNNDSILTNNTSPVTMPHATQISYEESDEDVMIPTEYTTRRHLESEGRNFIHMNSRATRTGNSVNSDHKYQYGLNYPDHLYCKHHRFFNWCGSTGTDSSNNIVGDATAGTLAACSPNVTIRTSSHIHHHLQQQQQKPQQSTQSQQPHPPDEIELQPTTPSSLTEISSYMLIDQRTVQPKAASNLYQKSHLKQSSTNSLDNDKSDSFVAVYAQGQSTNNTNVTGYPVVDLNQHIQHELALSVSQPHSQSVSTIFPTKVSTSSTTISNSQTAVHHVHSNSTTNAQSSQEFYTINDDDSLEINWPKETVNA